METSPGRFHLSNPAVLGGLLIRINNHSQSIFLIPRLVSTFSGKARAEGKGDPQRAACGRWTAAMIYLGRTRCMKK